MSLCSVMKCTKHGWKLDAKTMRYVNPPDSFKQEQLGKNSTIFLCVSTKPFFAWGTCSGGGHTLSHWGLYIIRVNYFLKSTLNEDEATVPTALWTLHRACAHQGIAPRFPTLSADCPRDLWIWYPFFHISRFSIYARYEPGGEKDTLFTCFYWRGCFKRGMWSRAQWQTAHTVTGYSGQVRGWRWHSRLCSCSLMPSRSNHVPN